MIRWDRSLWPKRDERAGHRQIVLTEHYTSRLNVCPHPAWFYDHGDNHLGSLPAGTIQLGGVTFDVRGVVFLRRPDISGPPYRLLWEQFPMQVEGIRVGQRVRRLHVLHSIVDRLYAGYAMSHIEQQPDNALVGKYILCYADGAREELPIVVGRHVRDWWAREGEENPYAALSEGTVVWTGSNPSAKDAQATLRLYLTSYENPHPEKEVVSVDYVSAMTSAAPFLVAMTIEP